MLKLTSFCAATSTPSDSEPGAWRPGELVMGWKSRDGKGDGDDGGRMKDEGWLIRAVKSAACQIWTLRADVRRDLQQGHRFPFLILEPSEQLLLDISFHQYYSSTSLEINAILTELEIIHRWSVHTAERPVGRSKLVTVSQTIARSMQNRHVGYSR